MARSFADAVAIKAPFPSLHNHQHLLLAFMVYIHLTLQCFTPGVLDDHNDHEASLQKSCFCFSRHGRQLDA